MIVVNNNIQCLSDDDARHHTVCSNANQYGSLQMHDKSNHVGTGGVTDLRV